MSIQDEPVVEATISDEELELELDLDDTEDVEALKAKIAEKDTFARQAVARAKKAEADLKALKASGTTAPATQTALITNNNALTADEIDKRVLKAGGMSDEVLEHLTKVAQVTGKSLFDAQNDDLFVAMKTRHEDALKAEKAKLGVSRGSGSAKKEKTLNTPGLSDAEHKDLWRQQNSA